MMMKNKKQENQENEPRLFVWRGSEIVMASLSLELSRDICPFCSAQLVDIPLTTKILKKNKYYLVGGHNCRLCGWGINDYRQYIFGTKECLTEARFLRAFSMSSSKLALHELGSHLKRNFSDVYLLDPYRFETLIGDVFHNIGYKVELTKKSCDGGVDLFILSGGIDRIGIIQCKRYKKNKKIGIEIVDRLIGTALAFDVKKAYLVTTSSYTQHALVRAMSPSVIRQGFQIKLLDAYDILRLLQVYNTELPPLNKLPPDFLLGRGLN